jgi:very-short-patch-repair endonuclease
MRNITSNRLSNPFYKQKLYDTKPELKFQSFLEFNEIEFSKQFVISTDIGKFTYDFYIPLFNMIVEIDGEYWHSKSIEQINRDLFKMKIANKRDFVILRLSDKDYRPELIFESLDNIENHNIQLIESRLLKRI